MLLNQIKWERVSETLEQAKIGDVVITKTGEDKYNIRLVRSNFVSDSWHDLDPVAAQCVLYFLLSE
jgi:sarcosine oxidase gamma subunit